MVRHGSGFQEALGNSFEPFDGIYRWPQAFDGLVYYGDSDGTDDELTEDWRYDGHVDVVGLVVTRPSAIVLTACFSVSDGHIHGSRGEHEPDAVIRAAYDDLRRGASEDVVVNDHVVMQPTRCECPSPVGEALWLARFSASRPFLVGVTLRVVRTSGEGQSCRILLPYTYEAWFNGLA